MGYPRALGRAGSRSPNNNATFILSDHIQREQERAARLTTRHRCVDMALPCSAELWWCQSILRLLFYRLAKLLTLPVLPLFVFDGSSRPTWKRGKQVKGRQHAIEQPFTQLIEAFGYQWHRAPGEAEAELAYLNQAGFVDAVLTDDAGCIYSSGHGSSSAIGQETIRY